jgi:hypothetical protein
MPIQFAPVFVAAAPAVVIHDRAAFAQRREQGAGVNSMPTGDS